MVLYLHVWERQAKRAFSREGRRQRAMQSSCREAALHAALTEDGQESHQLAAEGALWMHCSCLKRSTFISPQAFDDETPWG
jgi:hypothetical protein